MTVLTKHYSKQNFLVLQLTTSPSTLQYKELVSITQLKKTKLTAMPKQIR